MKGLGGRSILIIRSILIVVYWVFHVFWQIRDKITTNLLFYCRSVTVPLVYTIPRI